MIRVLSLFSGIGAFEKALDRIGIDWELVNYCEIDQFASKSYAMVHQCDESLNLRDVCKVTADSVRDRAIDLITYGFPCQDISIAGNQKGFENADGSHTRSGLFFEALRIIEDIRPKYAIAENVKALTSKKFETEFGIVLDSLEHAGYNNYWKVLNAKDYGIPQNRERVFIVSIRKDIDDGSFTFPKKTPLNLRLKDMLEDSVDEKYYLDENRDGVKKLIEQLETRYRVAEPTVVASRGRNPANPSDRTTGAPTEQRLEPNTDGCSNTLMTVQKDNYLVEPRIEQVGNIVDNPKRDSQRGRIYSPNGLAPTLNTVGGGGLEPKIVVDGNLRPDGHKQRARVFSPDGIAATVCATDYKEPPCISVIGQLKGGEKGRVLDSDGISYTLTATDYKDPVKIPSISHHGIRIRKLTPRECWRLMGFEDADFDSVQGISNSQLYKQAGNSIVVNVLEALLMQLFWKDILF